MRDLLPVSLYPQKSFGSALGDPDDVRQFFQGCALKKSIFLKTDSKWVTRNI